MRGLGSVLDGLDGIVADFDLIGDLGADAWDVAPSPVAGTVYFVGRKTGDGPGGIHVYDKDGNLVWKNEKGAKIYAVNWAQAQPGSVEVVWKLVEAANKDVATKVASAFGGREPYTVGTAGRYATKVPSENWEAAVAYRNELEGHAGAPITWESPAKVAEEKKASTPVFEKGGYYITNPATGNFNIHLSANKNIVTTKATLDDAKAWIDKQLQTSAEQKASSQAKNVYNKGAYSVFKDQSGRYVVQKAGSTVKTFDTVEAAIGWIEQALAAPGKTTQTQTQKPTQTPAVTTDPVEARQEFVTTTAPFRESVQTVPTGRSHWDKYKWYYIVGGGVAALAGIGAGVYFLSRKKKEGQ